MHTCSIQAEIFCVVLEELRGTSFRSMHFLQQSGYLKSILSIISEHRNLNVPHD